MYGSLSRGEIAARDSPPPGTRSRKMGKAEVGGREGLTVAAALLLRSAALQRLFKRERGLAHCLLGEIGRHAVIVDSVSSAQNQCSCTRQTCGKTEPGRNVGVFRRPHAIVRRLHHLGWKYSGVISRKNETTESALGGCIRCCDHRIERRQTPVDIGRWTKYLIPQAGVDCEPRTEPDVILHEAGNIVVSLVFAEDARRTGRQIDIAQWASVLRSALTQKKSGKPSRNKKPSLT